jgi:hypothetical protein
MLFFMAIVTMKIPMCDMCLEVTLPSKRLADGSLNPARKNPELQKRCGKCKSPSWNWKAEEAKAKKRAQRKQSA